jgi:HEAT repeat protein
MQPRFLIRQGSALCVALGLTLSAHGVSSQVKAPQVKATPAASATATEKGKPAKLDAAALLEDLSDPENLGRGLAAAQSAGPAASVALPRIEELLQKGLPPDLAALAIGALGAIGARSSSEVVAKYMQHRHVQVRRAAAEALGRTGGPEAKAALLRGMRSSDAEVRSLSASGLRFAGDKDSVPDLVKALDRGVTAAAPSIGALCAGFDCDEVLLRFHTLPAAAQKATLEAMLGRKPRLPDNVVLPAVDLAEAAFGAEGAAYFQSLKAGFKGSTSVRKALEAAGRPPKGAKP